jgi:NADH-quinone oxidoreductase subunit F
VFEELPFAGGMMRYAIPEYRMPRDIVEQEVDDIRALGVEIKTNTRIGKDISFEQLRKDFDIVIIAVGAHKSWKLDIEGEDLSGVWGAVEFLREVNLGRKVNVGTKVAIVGGGNSAIDAARTAKRLGAKDVTILYRRERKDMPAWENEIVAAEHEGVKIEYLVAPVKLIGKNDKLMGVECQRMKLGEFDRSGRRKPIAIPGSEFTLAVDTIVPAISQNTDASFIPTGSDVTIDKWGGIKTTGKDKNRTTADNVFIAGDAASGPATVVEAIAMGHKTAADVDGFIRARNNEPAYRVPPEEAIEIPFEVDEEVIETPKGKMPELKKSERMISFKEVELGYSKKTAHREACRCLRCDAEL